MPYEEVERLVRKEALEDRYEVGAELGRGKFAIVKRVTDKATGEKFAAKFLRKRRGGKACRDDIIVEVDIMRQSMSHHRIIKLREVFESTREMIIILELATGGELFRMIAVDPLPEDKARSVVLQLLQGVEHLHSLNIVHLDLKPENILLYRKGELDIRIADFGLALQITPGEQVKTLVGTAEYVAPEILNYEPLSIAADMWSIGALTYALLTGYSPFQGETHSHTFYNVSMCEYDFEDEVFDDVSQEAKDFIEELLIKKPNERLTASKCLCHPWIAKCNVAVQTPTGTSQTQEGLNSSTSSLDSALCLDSNISSLDPSPSSSASSSFAPRPSGKQEEDDQQQEDMKKQLTEKVSKLCTEMQKAEMDGITNSTLRQMDGSASSISSIDSNVTIKEETVADQKLDTPNDRPTSTPPYHAPSSPDRTRRSPSLNSSIEEDPNKGSYSRPGSGLQITDDAISLAPDTIERMKKLERLKQRKEAMRSHESLSRKGSADSVAGRNIAPRGSDRRTSTPASLKAPSANKFSTPVVKEEQAPVEPSSAPPIAKSKQETIKELENEPSPSVRLSTDRAISPNQREIENKKETTNKERSKSPHFVSSQTSESKVTLPAQSIDSNKQRSISPPSVTISQAKLEQSTKGRPNSPKMSEMKERENISTTKQNRPGHVSFFSREEMSLPISNNESLTKLKERAKSDSPSSSFLTSGSMTLPSRSSKSLSPSCNTSNETNNNLVTYRNKKSQNQSRKSWRNTPHIDPDVIEALLRGDIDDDFLDGNNADVKKKQSTGTKLETMPEVSEPRSNSPIAGKTMSGSPVVSKEDPMITPILKKGACSDSRLERVTKSESPRRVMILTNKTSGTVDLSASYSHPPSPLKTPGNSDSLNRLSSKNHLSSTLHQSMTLSRSTPDLSSILGSTKHSKRGSSSREDTYVTGTRKNSVSRSGSIRSTVLSGTSIVRSLTMSSKRSPSHSKFKIKK